MHYQTEKLVQGSVCAPWSVGRKKFAYPVKALERRVTHIQVHTFDEITLFCAYWDSVGRDDVTDRDMSIHMKFVAAKLGYPSRYIPLDRIEIHLTGQVGHVH